MLRNLFLQLDQNIESTWKEMASVGVMRECTDCAVNNGGSCQKVKSFTKLFKTERQKELEKVEGKVQRYYVDGQDERNK